MLIPVDCAVNDDHGGLSDRIAAIHFPGLELDACDMRGPRFRAGRGRSGAYRIKIGRCEWHCRHLRSHVGNIFWERYGLDPHVASGLLHRLRRDKAFTLDSGYEGLWKWWESRITDHEHVRLLLIEAAKDDRL